MLMAEGGLNFFSEPGTVKTGPTVKTVGVVAEQDAFIVQPLIGSDNQNALIFIHDLFGWQLPSSRVLAEKFAAAGYLVVMPDFFAGEAFPSTTPDRIAFLAKFSDEQVLGQVEAVIKDIKEHYKVHSIGVIGFCWGGRYATILAGSNIGVSVCVCAHGSRVDYSFIEAAYKPILYICAEEDKVFTKAHVERAKREVGKTSSGSSVILYPKVGHGFMVRLDSRDMINPDCIDQQLKSHADALAFFNSRLFQQREED